jgi:hypothetical protein
LIDLSLSGRVKRFPSNPVERKVRHIFFLVRRHIMMEESSGAHFLDIGSVTLTKDTFEVPKRSSVQIRVNPSDPFHSRPGRSV